ncbi:MAG: PilZ domain-containing protein [Phycisphaerae bacterium]|nr:PilZ domain-containing protein [Phycisphaerae bacterium]
MTEQVNPGRERREDARRAAAHRVVVLDGNDRVVARGRTANISVDGVLLIAPRTEALRQGREVVVEIDVPKIAHGQVRRGQHRTVRYRGRVVRTQQLGQLLGVGLEFVEKLA